MILGYLDNVVS